MAEMPTNGDLKDGSSTVLNDSDISVGVSPKPLRTQLVYNNLKRPTVLSSVQVLDHVQENVCTVYHDFYFFCSFPKASKADSLGSSRASNLYQDDPHALHEFRLELYQSGSGENAAVYFFGQVYEIDDAVEGKRAVGIIESPKFIS